MKKENEFQDTGSNTDETSILQTIRQLSVHSNRMSVSRRNISKGGKNQMIRACGAFLKNIFKEF